MNADRQWLLDAAPESRRDQRENLTIVPDDFWASTSNKQLNFVQHVKTLLAGLLSDGGTALP